MTGEQIAPALEAEAQKLILRVHVGHRSGTLSCDCGSHEVWLDGNAATADDVQRVARLIEHTRYDHAGPRAVLVTLPPVVLVDYADESRQAVAW